MVRKTICEYDYRFNNELIRGLCGRWVYSQNSIPCFHLKTPTNSLGPTVQKTFIKEALHCIGHMEYSKYVSVQREMPMSSVLSGSLHWFCQCASKADKFHRVRIVVRLSDQIKFFHELSIIKVKQPNKTVIYVLQQHVYLPGRCYIFLTKSRRQKKTQSKHT